MNAQTTATAKITAEDIRAAGEVAHKLAVKTLKREIPFLGVYGAAAEAGFASESLNRVVGYAYLAIIESNTTSIKTYLEDEMLVESCIIRIPSDVF